eukprot:SAG31_NODE_2753_length_5141_cov_3.640619_7_plen_80_part_00
MHSQNMPLKAEFRDHMDMLLQAAVQMTGPDDNHDALVEILGIFANMSPKVCDIENLVLKVKTSFDAPFCVNDASQWMPT